MMEQLQKPRENIEMLDSERGLKRNITAIRTPNRNTGKYKQQTNTLLSVTVTKIIFFMNYFLENLQFKSPARKEMRILREESSYEQQLTQEMENWKSLIRADNTQMEQAFVMRYLIESIFSDFFLKLVQL